MQSLDERLYIELIPSSESCKIIQKFANNLSDFVTGRTVDSSNWHVTLLHFGVPEHVYYDIQRDLPNVSKSTFREALERYIVVARDHLPEPTALQPTKVDLFGVRQNVAVLNFEPNDLLRSSHNQALKDVKLFLNECGLTDPETFMKGSINFKWALELKPHITLFRSVKKLIPDISVPDKKIEFISSRIQGLSS